MGYESGGLTWLTPHRIVVLMVIVAYYADYVPHESKIGVLTPIIQYIDGRDELSEDRYHGIEKLRETLKNTPFAYGDNLWDLVETNLKSWRSLDELYDFFGTVKALLSKEGVDMDEVNTESRKSIAGSSILCGFLKTCYLAFHRLSFDKISELWGSVMKLRREYGMEQDEEEEEDDDDDNEKKPLFKDEHVVETRSEPLVADFDLESGLDRELDDIESHGRAARSEVLKVLRKMEDQGDVLPPSAFLLEFQQACRDKDYEKALENMVRYYDYSISGDGGPRINGYQRALFMLAKMRAEFGATSEALRAVDEAINVARQHNDVQCLTQILMWLHEFILSHPSCPVPESIASLEAIVSFLKSKAGESPSLGSYVNLSNILRGLATGASPVSVFESQVRSSHVNLVNNFKAMETSAYGVYSAMWERHGQASLARVFSELAVVEKHADQQNEGAPNRFALLDAHMRRAHLLHVEGRPAESSACLAQAQELAKESTAHYLVYAPRLLLHKLHQALDGNYLDFARKYLGELQSFAADGTAICFDAKACEVRLETACGNYARATKCALSGVSATTSENADVADQLQFLLLYAQCLLATDLPSRALSLVMRGLILADESNHTLAVLEFAVILGVVLNHLERYSGALSTIDAFMPQILETENAELIGDAYDVLADGTIGIAGSPPDSDRVLRALKYNIEAGGHYQRKGCISKLARVCKKQEQLARTLDDRDRESQAAALYKKLSTTLAKNAASSFITA